jgi:hypothetical protein
MVVALVARQDILIKERVKRLVVMGEEAEPVGRSSTLRPTYRKGNESRGVAGRIVSSHRK